LTRRVLLLLLAADVVLAWLAAAGAVIFVERTWLALGGYAVPEAGLAEHLRQFAWLRRVQVLALGLTVAVAVAWARPVRPLGRAVPRALHGWWWAAIGSAVAADAAVRILSTLGPPLLAPGGPLPLLILAEILKIGAAVLTMAVVVRAGSARL
jgi:hypothetical protein